MTTTNAVRNLADRHIQMAQAARQIADLLGQFPELEKELALALNRPADIHSGEHPEDVKNGKPNAGLFTGPTTHMNRVIRFFMTTGNQLTSTPDLSKHTGLEMQSLSNVLWSSAGGRVFEKHAHPSNKRLKMWRMKPALIEAAEQPDETEGMDG